MAWFSAALIGIHLLLQRVSAEPSFLQQPFPCSMVQVAACLHAGASTPPIRSLPTLLLTPGNSEMAFARQLLKGDRKERAMLRRADNEKTYGALGEVGGQRSLGGGSS